MKLHKGPFRDQNRPDQNNPFQGSDTASLVFAVGNCNPGCCCVSCVSSADWFSMLRRCASAALLGACWFWSCFLLRLPRLLVVLLLSLLLLLLSLDLVGDELLEMSLVFCSCAGSAGWLCPCTELTGMTGTSCVPTVAAGSLHVVPAGVSAAATLAFLQDAASAHVVLVSASGGCLPRLRFPGGTSERICLPRCA